MVHELSDVSAQYRVLDVGASSPVRTLWNLPASAPNAALVLAPGSGETLADPVLAAIALAAADAGTAVVRFEYPHTTAGRRSPDAYPLLQNAVRGVLTRVREVLPGVPMCGGGKSMSGRVFTQLAAQGTSLEGLVLLGYALHATGRPERLRCEHWVDLTCPVLLVSGGADPLCAPDALRRAAATMLLMPSMHWIPDADHALNIPGDGPRTAAAHLDIARMVTAWISAVMDGRAKA